MLRVEDGAELLRFKSHADWVLGTCFTLDGEQLVSAGRDKALKIVDLANGRFVDDINNPIEQVYAFARHPKQDVVLYGGHLGTPRLYRISDNQKRTAARHDTNLVKAFERQRGAVHAVAFSPDGKVIAAGGQDPRVRLHDATSGKVVATLEGHAGTVFALAFDPRGKHVAAAGQDGTVRLHDAETGELTKAFVPFPPQGETAPRTLLASLRVEPASLALLDGRDERGVLVSAVTRAGERVDLTGEAVLEAGSEAVAVTAAGRVAAKAAGESSVLVRAGGLTARVPVRVVSAGAPPVHFAKDVMPVLSRAGCNTGTCHGAQDGQNGFLLSLRGFDPEFDHAAIVTELGGRRVDRVDPAQSLVLLKSTAAVPHEGHKVLDPGSRQYELLLQWIGEGAKYHEDASSRVARLEVLPRSADIAMPHETQHVLVIAHYEDGTSRDVTPDAILSSSNTEVAKLDGTKVIALRRGESAVLVRYEGIYATSPIMVMGDREGFAWTETPAFNFVDEHVHAKLRKVKTLPSELCTDAEFVRRVYLDLTGKPPALETAKAFVAGETPRAEKRARLLDELIGSPAYVEHWANKWADLLQCNSKTLGPKGVWVFRQWLSRQVAANRPYDDFVRDLVTARGSTYANPAANYMRALSDRGRTPDPDKMTEDVTQTFLGVRFSCNKCHNHPFERWTQDQYYEFGAHFARVRMKNGAQPGEKIVYDSFDGGETQHPKTKMTVAPEVPFDADTSATGENRRETLAAWLTSKDNRLFARSYVNRVWSYFFGTGIIEPVDDIRAGNPPSNPALLEALETSFVESGFDFNAHVRTICSSRTYQSSFRTNEWNRDDRINFSHAIPRRLSAEQLLDAVTVAAGVRAKIKGLPEGARPVEAPDGIVEGNDFLKLFGRPKRESACECARTSNLSLGHALNLVGGTTIHEAIRDPQGRVARLAASDADNRALVTELYWAALCRAPTTKELAEFSDLGSGDARRAAAEDLMWALLNSPAFLFHR